MNRKGFSLIELLCVMVVLALLMLLVSGTFNNVINKTKETISEAQEQSILNAAEKWSVDNSEKFDDIEGNKIQIGLDIVFVLDMSGSMTAVDILSEGKYISRNKAMIEAVNSAMQVLDSEMNRMSIVLFGNTSVEYLSLANYSTTNGKYVYYTGRSGALSEPTTNINVVTEYINVSSGLRKNGSSYSKSAQKLSGCTYTQSGLAKAASILLSTSDSSNRIPVVILLSDGAPSYGTTRYTNVGSTNVGSCKTEGDAESSYYTIKSAKYYKEQIQAHYNGNDVYFYTIGFGLQEGSYEEVVLNPTNELVTKLKSNTNRIARELSGYLQKDSGSGFSYADKAYLGKFSASELADLFINISTEVVEATKVTQVCVTVQDLYDSGYLSTKDIDLASGEAASTYVIMNFNEATNQYSFALAKTDQQKKDCQALLGS